MSKSGMIRKISFHGGNAFTAMKEANIKASSFLGKKQSTSDFVKSKQTEAEYLVVSYYNGQDNNFGFNKPVGV